MFDPADETKKQKAVRPRDAATLILVRRSSKGAEVLMGKRSANLKFMPGKFVFPGGRLDPSDIRLSHAGSDLRPEVLRRLAAHGGPARARGLARAAIREMYEEAGVLIGKASPSRIRTRAGGWSGFLGLGIEPDLAALTYIFRAITPPYRDRRFDTRFFIADASAMHEPPGYARSESGELLELEWFSTEAARGLDLPTITRRVMDEIDERGEDLHADKPVPFIWFNHGKPAFELI